MCGIIISMVSEIKSPAAAFKALGDPTRLRIIENLACCDQTLVIDDEGQVRITEGPTAGDVCCSITGAEKITSTVSHHLKELREAGLIQMDRQGKHMLCAIDWRGMRTLLDYLMRLTEGEANDHC